MSARVFRTLAENSTDAIFRYDLDCRRIYVNPTGERIRGIAAATLLGTSPIDELPGEVNLGATHVACVQQVLASGTALESEANWSEADGTLRTFHLRYVPEHGPHGKVVSVLAIGHDITRLMEVERELLQSRELLRTLMAHQEKNREEKPERAALDVHEELGQNLMALRMNVSMLETLLNKSAHTR